MSRELKIFFGGLVLGLLITLLSFSLGKAAEIPTLNSRVMDTAKILTAKEIQSLTEKIQDLEKSPNGPQLAILTIRTLDGEEIDAYKVRVFEQWKLGKAGIDNGVLIVQSTSDRKIAIEVGYGLEGSYPDGRTKDTINLMKPYLAKDKPHDAYAVAIKDINSILVAESVVEPISIDSGAVMGAFFFVLILGGIVTFIVISARKRERERLEAEARERERLRKKLREEAEELARKRTERAKANLFEQLNRPQRSSSTAAGVAVGVAGGLTAAEVARRASEKSAENERRINEEARRRREQEEDDRQRRRRDEESSVSSWSSSSTSSSNDSTPSYSGDGGSSGGSGSSDSY